MNLIRFLLDAVSALAGQSQQGVKMDILIAS
jgi:hypothetical protein